MAGVVAEDRIVAGQDRAAAVAEHDFDAFVRENLHEHVRAGHRLACERVRGFGDGVHGQCVRATAGGADLIAFWRGVPIGAAPWTCRRSEEHTSELLSLMRISSLVLFLINTLIDTVEFIPDVI